MSDVTLGTPPVAGLRDAVHVAVIAMEASANLRPGERVGIVEKGVAGPAKKVVGIVDPFLTEPVEKGERFWLCLLPNSVTGMRHQWLHPEFLDEKSSGPADYAKERFRDICETLGFDVDDVLQDDHWIVNGDYRTDSESTRDDWYSLAEEFWELRKAITGKDVDDDKKGSFSCSC